MYERAASCRRLELIQGEADRHAEPIRQPGANEGFVAPAAHSLDEEAGDVVAEIVVLPGGADIAAQLEVAHRAEHLGGRAVAREMHPIVAGQAGLVAQQIAHGGPVRCHRVAETKLRDVVADWLRPIETPLVVQESDGGCRERLGAMRNWVDGVTGRFASTSRRP
jgi:hypothetical protein